MILQPSVEQHQNWIGVDVGKRTFHAALALSGQRWGVTELSQLKRKEFQRSPAGVAEFVSWAAVQLSAPHDQLNSRVVMETTGKYSTELAHWMNERNCGLNPAIVHACQTSAFIKSMNVRGKTDGLEARALAFYGAERNPAAYVELPAVQRQLRELVRHRAQLVELKLALENRKGEGSESPFVRKSQEKMWRNFQREIEHIERKIKDCIIKEDNLKRDTELLCSIYGVASVTASVVLAEIGDLRRFERARQLTAFAGLSPRPTQSGSSIYKPTHICKQGSAYVRKTLYMAALTAMHDAGPLQEAYQQALAKGKPKKAAIGIVMRKLLVLMRAILISGKPYDRQWKTREKLPEKD